MTSDTALLFAQKAIEFFASHEDPLNALMAQSGLGADDFRNGAHDPAFLAGLLDFLLQHEVYLIDFCDFAQIRPEEFISMRKKLPGAEALWEG